MRRMISERERAPLKNMGFDEATNTVEIGTNLEVDGEIKVNNGNQYLHYSIIEVTTGDTPFRITFQYVNDKDAPYSSDAAGFSALKTYLFSLYAKKQATFRMVASGAYTSGENTAVASHMDIKSDRLDIYGINLNGTTASGLRIDNITPTFYDDVIKIM